MEEQNKVNIEVVSVDDLIQDDHNFNRGTEQGQQLIERSFRECGAGRSVFIDKDNRLVGGNKAQKGFKAAGKKRVVIVDSDPDTLVAVRRKDVSLDSAEGRRMALLDNLTTQVNLAWDPSEIEAVGSEIDGFDPSDYGFDPSQLEVAGMGDETKPTTQTEVKEDDFDPDAHYETKVKRGEVWQLGNHRLMCGDSTSADDVARLMNGERADLLFTSPPYSDMRAYNGGKDLSVVSLAKFIPTYEPYAEYQCVNLGLQVKDGEIVQYWDAYIASAKDCGYKLMGWNVWDKLTTGAISNQVDFITPTRHEWLFVFGKAFKEINRTWEKKPESIVKGDVVKKIRGNGDDFHSSTTGDHSQPYKKMESVLSITSEHGEIRSEHPAVFPVRLPAEYIAAFTNEGNIVIEPFGGSGTTMIAAEQLGRKCRMMELDPHYCTVIIARWEKLTGEKAVKLNP